MVLPKSHGPILSENIYMGNMWENMVTLYGKWETSSFPTCFPIRVTCLSVSLSVDPRFSGQWRACLTPHFHVPCRSIHVNFLEPWKLTLSRPIALLVSKNSQYQLECTCRSQSAGVFVIVHLLNSNFKILKWRYVNVSTIFQAIFSVDIPIQRP